MVLSPRIGASIIGAFCAAMGINAISNATDLLAGKYQVSLSELSPATSFYLLAEIAALPLVPIAVKQFGPQRLLRYSLIGFLIASLLCMMTQTISQLIFARAIQGFLGGALLILPGMLVKLETPVEHQTKTLVFLSVASAFAPIVGPMLTSLTTSDTVHIIFAIMAGFITLAILFLPIETELKPSPQPLPMKDIGMLFTFCGGLVAMVWGLENIQEWGGWHDQRVQLHVFIGLGLVLLSALHQWGKTGALLPLHVLRDFRYAGLLLSGILVGVIIYGFIYLIPYYLIRVHQAGVQQLFHISLYVAIPQLLFLPVILFLRSRVPTYTLACMGAGIGAFSVWNLTGLGIDFHGSHWLLPQGLRAIASPMIILPLSLLLLKLPKPEDTPAMNSLYGLFRTLGGVIGISGLTVFTDSRQSYYEQIIMMNAGVESVPRGDIVQQSWLYAFNDTFYIISIMLLSMLIFFIVLSRTQPVRQN